MNFFYPTHFIGAATIAWGAPSFQELIVILIIVLIVFGAKRLPELARALGQSMNEFRKTKDEFEKEFHKSASPSSPIEAPKRPSPPQTIPVAGEKIPHPSTETPVI